MLMLTPSSWYNIPPPPTTKAKSKGKGKVGASPTSAPALSNGTSSVDATHASENAGADSTPLNFDTFVPAYDPSLAAAGPLLTVPPLEGTSTAGTGAEAATVSQDEAFSRAMTAMYWSGYWTAIYHVSRLPLPTLVSCDITSLLSIIQCRRNEATQQGGVEAMGPAEQGEARGIDVDDEDEDMLPAQR